MERTQDEILKDIRNVECRLSQENLTCDGETQRLRTKKRKLIKELGHEPTYEELLGDFLPKRHRWLW